MTYRPALPAIPGFCVGCQKPTNAMPLCVQCIAVWESDGDRWTYADTHSQALREKANAWRSAQQFTGR